nr:RNA-directed DNA polymerase, eukaryota [Tanacetum cinerariifolium]
MESLHLSFSRDVEAGIFTGIKIDSSLTLSHLFYADDAVFIGEWSNGNLIGIMNILRCFSLLSGMSINIHKSHLLGIGVSDVSVSEAVNPIGCSVMKASFRYLGIMVGGNMSLVKEWDESIAKLKKKLSKWKLKTLSVGGRLTLLKAVLGSTPIYNMSLFKVPKQVLNSMERMQKFTVSVTGSFRRDVRGGQNLIRFSVKDVRCLLDDVFLPKAEVPTRNVAVASLLCPLSDSGMEDAAHLFFRCDMTKDVMFLVSHWWDLEDRRNLLLFEVKKPRK